MPIYSPVSGHHIRSPWSLHSGGHGVGAGVVNGSAVGAIYPYISTTTIPSLSANLLRPLCALPPLREPQKKRTSVCTEALLRHLFHGLQVNNLHLIERDNSFRKYSIKASLRHANYVIVTFCSLNNSPFLSNL